MCKKCISGFCISLILLAAVVMVAGYAGTAGAAGPVGPADLAGPTGLVQVTADDPVPPETCSICHSEAGAEHQASYDQLYQDGVIQVTDLAYEFSSPNTHIVTFQMTKDGAPFDANDADSLAIYFAPYTGTKFQFEPAADRLDLKGEIACDGAGGCTSTLAGDGSMYESDFGGVDGLVVVYGADEQVGQLPARIRLVKYPFAALLETGAGVDYVSSANNAGCEKCHSIPYLKHGYIYGQVDRDPATDFYTCKACHLDNGVGEHFEWQLMVNEPALAAEFLAGEAELTPEQEALYAYQPTLMNDVHMSHAMEFPYPQSMANCVTCHEGKLDTILADANFTVQTCKSCHPVTGSEEHGTAELALKTILPSPIHDDMDLATVDCASCHSEGSGAAVFSEIHSGYDTVIYTADGLRYSEAISVTIDSAAFDGEMLNFKFSAGESPDIEGLDVADIVPTVMVGLYGYDTKDYIIGPHERLFDDNEDGAIDGDDQRTLEAEVGTEHPRVTTVSAEGGSWEVTADLSAWTDLIADNVVKRVEIAVMPALADADGVMLALDAPSRTFDLAANAFVDDFYGPITMVEGCENCHAALATNYHTPDRGGNIVVCRMCHITKSGSSHLEMQSRSIDSYAHAIHSGQALDIADIDFTDPVAAMHYEHHIEFPYPTHGITNCESCHVAGTYNTPDQSKSLPGLLSASEPVTGWDRNIGEVPSYVTGPGSRACGGCHRADLINEDAAGELAALNQHIKQGGYMIEAGEAPLGTLGAVIDEIMALFK